MDTKLKIHPGVTLGAVGVLWCVRGLLIVLTFCPLFSLPQAFLLSVFLEPSAAVSPTKP